MKLWKPKPQGHFGQRELRAMLSYQERKQNDAMPAQWGRRIPLRFHAAAWITAYRDLPRVKGRLK